MKWACKVSSSARLAVMGVVGRSSVGRITQPPGESIVLDGTAGPVLVAPERAILDTPRESFEIEHRSGEVALVRAGEKSAWWRAFRSNGACQREGGGGEGFGLLPGQRS